jgi:hypothetical protein
MKRTSAAILLLGGLAGLAGAWLGNGGVARGGPYMSDAFAKECPDGICSGCYHKPAVPGLVGPWGQPVEMVHPYSASPPGGEATARAMLAQSVPLDLQMAAMAEMGKDGPAFFNGGPAMPGFGGPMPPMGPMGPMGPMPPMGPMGPMPPYGMQMMPQGPLPLPPGTGLRGGPILPVSAMDPNIMQTAGNNGIMQVAGPGPGGPFPVSRTEVRFVGPAGMKISWYTTQLDGKPGFGAQTLEAPGRYNFLQAAIYRLKLSDIPNRAGVELYPTLEVVPANSKTSTFLAHSSVPVTFTEEDFDQVLAGNFVVKVIYLPDPQYQDLATTGLAEVVSSQLEPGVDPIHEAQRRGNILLVVRLGNIDLEAPNTPAMDAPGPYQQKPLVMPPPPGPSGLQPPGGMSRMVPYGYQNGMGAAPPNGAVPPNGTLPPGATRPPQVPNGAAQQPRNMMPPTGPLPSNPASRLTPPNPLNLPNSLPAPVPSTPSPVPPFPTGPSPVPPFPAGPRLPAPQQQPVPPATPVGQATPTPVPTTPVSQVTDVPWAVKQVSNPTPSATPTIAAIAGQSGR